LLCQRMMEELTKREQLRISTQLYQQAQELSAKVAADPNYLLNLQQE